MSENQTQSKCLNTEQVWLLCMFICLYVCLGMCVLFACVFGVVCVCLCVIEYFQGRFAEFLILFQNTTTSVNK